MSFEFEDFATPHTKTLRKDARRKIREQLGTSSDPAPTILDGLDAATFLDSLVFDASHGRYKIAVVDTRGSRRLTPAEAASQVIVERAARRDRLADQAEASEALTPADRDEVYVGLGDLDGGEP